MPFCWTADGGAGVAMAYSPCIDWGIDTKDMADIQRVAVVTGYWQLYRFMDDLDLLGFFKEHLAELGRFLDDCIAAVLKVKVGKCFFAQLINECLGFLVVQRARGLDPDKISTQELHAAVGDEGGI